MKQFLGYIMLIVSVSSCIEPFEFETRDAEGILVVQTTMTDAFEKKFVILSRAANLENINIEPIDSLDVRRPIVRTINERVNPETGAAISLIDDQGNIFEFEDRGEGVYESVEAFALINNRSYQLGIITNNNETYESNFEALAGKSQIDDIYVERGLNDTGEEGVLIYINGSDSSNQSDYFRYEYEETYKIIAPNYTGKELEILREEQEFLEDGTILWPDVRVVNVEKEEQVCFNNASSLNIVLANTSRLASPVLERHAVRFLEKDNPIIAHRYSILSKQYVINSAAYNYYQNLSNFSQSESVFSEIQPGFLEGNIRRTDVDNGLVLGYFEVASVSEQRVFFNYVDFFPNEPLPPYFGDTNCDRTIAPSLGNPFRDGPQPMGCPAAALIRRTQSNEISYVGENVPGECEGPYLMTPSLCADCTVLGSNIVPDFWIE